MDMESTPQTTSGSDLLVARGKVTAARARAATPSDNTGGRSDSNDSI
jgi:hypothetical protein